MGNAAIISDCAVAGGAMRGLEIFFISDFKSGRARIRARVLRHSVAFPMFIPSAVFRNAHIIYIRAK